MTSGGAVAGGEEVIDDDDAGLHLLLHREWLSPGERSAWWEVLAREVKWFRVCYKSARFGTACETPCYTSFFGGVSDRVMPFVSVPAWLQPLVDQVSARLGTPFNAILLRLYIDGSDEIAWHTDGRKFLGPTPTIASLSFGATASFQMRRMTELWPSVDGGSGGGGGGIDRLTPQREFAVRDGDLLVMRGTTQQHWHHRVPKERSRR